MSKTAQGDRVIAFKTPDLEHLFVSQANTAIQFHDAGVGNFLGRYALIRRETITKAPASAISNPGRPGQQFIQPFQFCIAQGIKLRNLIGSPVRGNPAGSA